MHGRAILLVLITCLTLTVALAQPDPNAGQLRGTVRLEDGTPLGNIHVTVTAGNTSQNFITDANGGFWSQLPPGKAQVTALGKEVTADVTTGLINEIAIVIPLTGVMLNIIYEDGEAVEAGCSAACRSPQGAQELTGQSLGNGRIWFPEAPADITRFSAIATIASEGRRQARQEWDITQPAKAYPLTMTLQRLPRYTLAVVDGNGKPVANAPVHALISYTVWRLVHWQQGKPTSGNGYRLDTTALTTDARGMLDLGVLPPSTGELYLVAGGLAGMLTKFEIQPDGTSTLATYPVSLSFRRVEQTVVDAGGTPQPGALVHASYCWQGQGSIIHARADDRGVVTWDNLPPVRVIVWGDTVPAGVIPADAVNVTGRLPAPQLEGGRFTRFVLANTGTEPFTATWYITPREGYAPGPYVHRYTPSSDPGRIWETNPRASGRRISVAVITDTSPPRLAYLQDIYEPYTEERGDVVLTLPLQEVPELHGRLVAPGGREIPGVSRLTVVPKAPVDLPPIARQALRMENGLAVNEHPDGTFSVPLPAPGAYTLQVDLFDETVPTPDALRLVAKPGVNTCVFTLPEPLLTVPAGTELTWATRYAPTRFRNLRVAAQAPEMPIFGPQDRILALWGRMLPNRLLLYTPLAGNPVRELSLRSAYLSLTTPDGGPVYSKDYLRPMLPQPISALLHPGAGDPAHPEGSHFAIIPGIVQRQELWSGPYMVAHDNYFEQTADIPADGPAEIALHTDKAQYRPILRNESERIAIFPKSDYASLAKQGSGSISFKGNIPCRTIYQLDPARAAGTRIALTPGATTLSVEWLGSGIMRDVPISANGNIMLPDWQPGQTLKGQILTSNGTPYANQGIRIRTCYSWPTYSFTLNTDVEGRFAVQGIIPGTIFITLANTNTPGGWTVEMPEAGLPEVTLRMTETPIVVEQGYANEEPYYYNCWWVPANGTPVQLPVYSQRFFSSYALPASPGWLWAINNAGTSLCTHLDNIAGAYNVKNLTSDGSPLSLFFPYNPQQGFPEQVVLMGEGPLTGLHAEFNAPTWQPLPQLGVTLFQLDAVPPGPYRVIVNTPQGQKTARVTVDQYGGYAMMNW